MALSDIQTIIFVIMENRSFDHMLGYLSLQGTLGVEGLQADAAWLASYANGFAGKTYPIVRIDPTSPPCSDPQHDYQSIALQIGTPTAGGSHTNMGGFVESYARFSDPKPADPSQVMGYFHAASLPTFDFFARNYCVCDHWFASLPLGTQANRLMAMAGESSVLDNDLILPDQDLVYDWLTARDITWRAYQAGDFFPFFTLMPAWLPEIALSLSADALSGIGRFRRYEQFRSDWNDGGDMPSVMFIEPQYTDGPHDNPNDDHAPTGVAPGQSFLARVYQDLTSNKDRWAKTLLVVTYDEHGGFFDHVPPLPMPSNIKGQAIQTTGVRVPAFLISPYVKAGDLFSGPLDHTSLLQLLDDRFSKGSGYSEAVNARQVKLNRISNALTDVPRAGPAPSIPAPAVQAPQPAQSRPTAPHTNNARAFHAAALKLAKDHPEVLARPGWQKVNQYLASTQPRKAV